MKKGQKDESGYVSRDPEKRKRQLANLRQFQSPERKAEQRRKRAEKYLTAAELQAMNVIEFATDPRALGLNLYPAQDVILRAYDGLPMMPEQMKLFSELTGGRDYVPGHPCRSAVWCLGARSGKSLMAAIIALHRATRDKWKRYLRRKEAAYVTVVATKLDQARMIIQRNAASMIVDSPLARLLESDPTSQEIVFKNGMRIISLPCNSTAGRGIPIPVLIYDEFAHFYGEGFVRADADVHNSLRPRQAQFGSDAETVMISTPAAKQGEFWKHYHEGFEFPGRLTCQAATWIMNPTIPQEFFETEKARDIDNYLREYGAEFAERTENFFPESIITAAVKHFEDLPPKPQFRYSLGVDFSGLSGRDKTGVAVTHREANNVLNDAVRSMDSTDSEVIIKEITALAGRYGIDRVSIDKYGAGWTKQALEKAGLIVEIREPLPMIYAHLKRLMTAGQAELQDHPDLVAALRAVRAFYGRNNSLSIQHERGTHGHGDIADALATAAYSSGSTRKPEADVEPEYVLADFNPLDGPVWRRNPHFGEYKLLNIKVERID